jgi:hypothetical protein
MPNSRFSSQGFCAGIITHVHNAITFHCNRFSPGLVSIEGIGPGIEKNLVGVGINDRGRATQGN